MKNDKYSPEAASLWSPRLQKADEYYMKWSDRFKCETAENYYEGFQWANTGTYAPYVMNLVFSTIEVKIPNLLFSEPIATIRPRPGKAEYDPDTAWAGALIKQDVLNTWSTDKDNKLVPEMELCIVDAFFRFGIMEVGFSTDWIENPNANKPVLKSERNQDSESGEVLREPEMIPLSEVNYVRRVEPWRFRVGGMDSYDLERCNWCGYYEYVRREDLLAAKNLKNLDQVTGGPAARSEEYVEKDGASSDEENPQGDLVKIWKLWNNRTKEKIIYNETNSAIHLCKSFKRLPLFPLLYHKRSKGFYPLPPVFNWLPMQNETNEAREMQRIHRRRFIRKYFYNKNLIPDEVEADKLQNGPDGSFIGVEGDPEKVAAPLQNAALDQSATQTLVVSRDEFNLVSGTTSEQRGVSDRETATQSVIINKRSQVREGRSAKTVSNWLEDILKEVLLQMKENNVLPYWIMKTQGEKSDWEAIMLEELDDFDFDVVIDVAQMSTTAQDEGKKNFLEFLAVLNNYPQMAFSPDLIREAARQIGYRNEKVLKPMIEMATIAMVGQIEQGKAAVSQMAQRQTAMSTPNEMEKTGNQLKNQVGLQPDVYSGAMQ